MGMETKHPALCSCMSAAHAGTNEDESIARNRKIEIGDDKRDDNAESNLKNRSVTTPWRTYSSNRRERGCMQTCQSMDAYAHAGRRMHRDTYIYIH
eukprot:6194551-Pleurochrysis_carterae.AAC.4